MKGTTDKMRKNQTQVRLPENLYLEIKQEADEIGISMNSHLIELLWYEIKARKNIPVINYPGQKFRHD